MFVFLYVQGLGMMTTVTLPVFNRTEIGVSLKLLFFFLMLTCFKI